MRPSGNAAPTAHVLPRGAERRSGKRGIPGAGWLIVLGAAACLASAGCTDEQMHFTEADRYGRTYYIDGAGNWGYGVAEIRQGLRAAGYRGNIVIYGWTISFNPAIDQTLGRLAARARGEELGQQINKYHARFPDQQVNIIALSAGTGVAVWACEHVVPPATVHNLVLLGSSLSSRYDMRKALRHIDGKVYVYYSPSDMVLQGPVRTLGTIDGQLGVDAAGLVGLHPPGGGQDKIVNIRWSPKYERYGWTGAHTDATCVPFVRHYIARHIVPELEQNATTPIADGRTGTVGHPDEPPSMMNLRRRPVASARPAREP